MVRCELLDVTVVMGPLSYLNCYIGGLQDVVVTEPKLDDDDEMEGVQNQSQSSGKGKGRA